MPNKNPNPSPIGTRFGFILFGAAEGTLIFTSGTLDPNGYIAYVKELYFFCIVLTITASAPPRQWHRNELIYDGEIGFIGNVTLQFALDGGSFIRPITKKYGESISLESCVPTKYGYTFKGWFTDPRTKQNQVTTFKFTKPDVLYAKWEKNPKEPINPNEGTIPRKKLYR